MQQLRKLSNFELGDGSKRAVLAPKSCIVKNEGLNLVTSCLLAKHIAKHSGVQLPALDPVVVLWGGWEGLEPPPPQTKHFSLPRPLVWMIH